MCRRKDELRVEERLKILLLVSLNKRRHNAEDREVILKLKPI
jgi:hypothetical protein